MDKIHQHFHECLTMLNEMIVIKEDISWIMFLGLFLSVALHNFECVRDEQWFKVSRQTALHWVTQKSVCKKAAIILLNTARQQRQGNNIKY